MQNPAIFDHVSLKNMYVMRAFHLEQEVYLESTDIDEMYMKMKDRVIENLAVFQRGQSGWRFRSIVSMFLRLNINR